MGARLVQASLVHKTDRTKLFLSDSTWILKKSTMKVILLCFSFQVGDGRSCVHTLAQAGFAHIRFESPATEPEQQSNFWWVCVHHHNSPQPQKYQPYLSWPPRTQRDQCITLAAQTACKMRWHCPSHVSLYKSVIPESWRISELHRWCLQRLTEKSRSPATRRSLHLHTKTKIGDHRSNPSETSNLLYFTEPSWRKGIEIKWSLEIDMTIRWGSLLLCFTHLFFHTFLFPGRCDNPVYGSSTSALH